MYAHLNNLSETESPLGKENLTVSERYWMRIAARMYAQKR